MGEFRMLRKAARVPRFHLEVDLNPDTSIELPDEAARHALQVLRLRTGDAVTLFNSQGGEFDALIEDADRRVVRLRVAGWRDVERESPLAATLVQGISASDRMDFTIQKAVELGVAGIQPVATERAVVRLSEDRAASRQSHWRRIAIASCAQCGRNRVPAIHPVLSLEEYCDQPPGDGLRLLLAPGDPQRLRDLGRERATGVTLAAGPEAGFSAEEEARLLRAGFIAVGLGPRVLRTETAAPAALAALNALYGDS